MGGFLGCKPQGAWEKEVLLILKAVAANTLTVVVTAKGFLRAASSPPPLQQLQLPSPPTSQLLEVLPGNAVV